MGDLDAGRLFLFRKTDGPKAKVERKPMVWWYELRGEGNRLVKMRRGFRTRQEARRAAEQTKRLIQSETITVKTGS